MPTSIDCWNRKENLTMKLFTEPKIVIDCFHCESIMDTSGVGGGGVEKPGLENQLPIA